MSAADAILGSTFDFDSNIRFLALQLKVYPGLYQSISYQDMIQCSVQPHQK